MKFSEQMSEEVKHWGKGFEMILNQFKDALHNQGVTPINAAPGEAFDPHIHEAVETVITEEYPPDTIVHESTRGYRMGGKTLRPARVTVAKEGKEEELQKEEEENIKKESQNHDSKEEK